MKNNNRENKQCDAMRRNVFSSMLPFLPQNNDHYSEIFTDGRL